jgi:hypothetical protein
VMRIGLVVGDLRRKAMGKGDDVRKQLRLVIQYHT